MKIPSLFEVPDPPQDVSPKERFDTFHAANPKVYDALERMTEELWARGRRRIGIGMLFEVLRWNYYMTTDDPSSEFRLNNNYRAWYARLLMARHPLWQAHHLFELRASEGDDE